MFVMFAEYYILVIFFFFFQAEDGIRDLTVTGVQTCALPIYRIYFAFSFGPFIGFWLAFESAARLGCLCIPGGGLSSIARLHAIIDNKVTVKIGRAHV